MLPTVSTLRSHGPFGGFEATGSGVLDAGGLTAREIADQLGHARPSITMDRYMGRKVASDRGATVLESLA